GDGCGGGKKKGPLNGRKGDGPAVLRPRQQEKLARGAKPEEHAMSAKANSAIAVIGIDIGKNSFHVVGQDKRGAIMLRQKWSRGQAEARLANLPPCLIGMEGLRRCASSESQAANAWTRRSAYAGEVRAPVFEGTEERFPRCGGHR